MEFYGVEDIPNIDSKPKGNNRGWVYLVNTKHGHKIGMSCDIKTRLKKLEQDHKHKVQVLHYFELVNGIALRAERFCQSLFKHKRNDFGYEYFNLSPDDVARFKSVSFYNEVIEGVAEIMDEEYLNYTSMYKRELSYLNGKIETAAKTREKLNKRLAELSTEINNYQYKSDYIQQLLTAE